MLKVHDYTCGQYHPPKLLYQESSLRGLHDESFDQTLNYNVKIVSGGCFNSLVSILSQAAPATVDCEGTYTKCQDLHHPYATDTGPKVLEMASRARL